MPAIYWAFILICFNWSINWSDLLILDWRVGQNLLIHQFSHFPKIWMQLSAQKTSQNIFRNVYFQMKYFLKYVFKCGYSSLLLVHRSRLMYENTRVQNGMLKNWTSHPLYQIVALSSCFFQNITAKVHWKITGWAKHWNFGIHTLYFISDSEIFFYWEGGLS